MGSFIKHSYIHQGNANEELSETYLVETLNDTARLVMAITQGAGVPLFDYETAKAGYKELVMSDPLSDHQESLLDLVFIT